MGIPSNSNPISTRESDCHKKNDKKWAATKNDNSSTLHKHFVGVFFGGVVVNSDQTMKFRSTVKGEFTENEARG